MSYFCVFPLKKDNSLNSDVKNHQIVSIQPGLAEIDIRQDELEGTELPSFSKFCLCTNDHKTGALPVLWTMFIIIVALILPVLSFGADIWIYVEGNSVAHKIFWLSRQPKLTQAETVKETVKSLDAVLMMNQNDKLSKRQIQETNIIKKRQIKDLRVHL